MAAAVVDILRRSALRLENNNTEYRIQHATAVFADTAISPPPSILSQHSPLHRPANSCLLSSHFPCVKAIDRLLTLR